MPMKKTLWKLRSALYNWPAKIKHWPADLHGSNLYLKTRPYSVLCLFYQYKTVGIGRPMFNFGRPIVKCTPYMYYIYFEVPVYHNIFLKNITAHSGPTHLG